MKPKRIDDRIALIAGAVGAVCAGIVLAMALAPHVIRSTSFGLPFEELVNPGFEAPYNCPAPALCAANGWTPWYINPPRCRAGMDGCDITCPQSCKRPDGAYCIADYACYWQQPELGEIRAAQFPYRVLEGASAQKQFSVGRMHEAGVYQKVKVNPDQYYEFGASFQAWMCYVAENCKGGRQSDYPTTFNIRVGIDPYGGTVPTSTNIVWSEPVSPTLYFDHYYRVTVRAQAKTDRVTVWIYGKPDWDWARWNNDLYVDGAEFRWIAPPVTPTPTPVRRYLPFVASYVTPTVIPTVVVTPGPTPVYTPSLNTGGLHVEVTGSHTGYGDFLRACHNAGRPVGLVKSVCDGGVLMEAKSIDARTVTIYRCPTYFDGSDDQDNPGNYDWMPNQTADIARRWMEANYPRWMLDYAVVDYYEPTNEGNPATIFQTQNFSNFHLEAMRLADAHNPPLKLAVGSFSAGTPEPWQLEIMRPMFEYAAAHGHIVAWHDGTLVDYQTFEEGAAAMTALRYRQLLAMMGDGAPVVAITEGYQSGAYLKPNWPSQQWYLGELGRDKVIGWAWFTLGSYSFGGDGDVNIQRQLRGYARSLGCDEMPKSIIRMGPGR